MEKDTRSFYELSDIIIKKQCKKMYRKYKNKLPDLKSEEDFYYSFSDFFLKKYKIYYEEYCNQSKSNFVNYLYGSIYKFFFQKMRELSPERYQLAKKIDTIIIEVGKEQVLTDGTMDKDVIINLVSSQFLLKKLILEIIDRKKQINISKFIVLLTSIIPSLESGNSILNSDNSIEEIITEIGKEYLLTDNPMSKEFKKNIYVFSVLEKFIFEIIDHLKIKINISELTDLLISIIPCLELGNLIKEIIVRTDKEHLLTNKQMNEADVNSVVSSIFNKKYRYSSFLFEKLENLLLKIMELEIKINISELTDLIILKIPSLKLDNVIKAIINKILRKKLLTKNRMSVDIFLLLSEYDEKNKIVRLQKNGKEVIHNDHLKQFIKKYATTFGKINISEMIQAIIELYPSFKTDNITIENNYSIQKNDSKDISNSIDIIEDLNNNMIHIEQSLDLERFADKLSEREKRSYKLRKAGYKYREIAIDDEIGCDQSTVKRDIDKVLELWIEPKVKNLKKKGYNNIEIKEILERDGIKKVSIKIIEKIK